MQEILGRDPIFNILCWNEKNVKKIMTDCELGKYWFNEQLFLERQGEWLKKGGECEASSQRSERCLDLF